MNPQRVKLHQRGEQPRPDPTMKQAFVGVWLRPREKLRLTALATLRGTSLSETLRSLIGEACAQAAGARPDPHTSHQGISLTPSQGGSSTNAKPPAATGGSAELGHHDPEVNNHYE